MSVIILGIESSCDDTSAAVIEDGMLRSNVIASQKVHEQYGGVVPELASRAPPGTAALRSVLPKVRKTFPMKTIWTGSLTGRAMERISTMNTPMSSP